MDENFRTLYKLVRSDENVEEIRHILNEVADPNYQMYAGNAPLHVAALFPQDNPSVVKELIRCGANVNLCNNLGETALHFAAMQQKCSVVEILLQFNAFVNAKTTRGETPLNFAFKSLHYQIETHSRVLEILLDHNDIDCNVVAFNGDTPLMVAVRGNQKKVTKLLLRKKANPQIPDKYLDTALHVAFTRKFDYITLVLLKVGANIYALNKDGKSPLDILFETMTPDEHRSKAPTYLKCIASRYYVTADVKQKLQRFPELLQNMEKWCEEVNCMKSDILIYDITFHDFVLNCYDGPENPQYPEYLVSEMHKRAIERFVMGSYPEYFTELFVYVPSSSLREVLQITVEWRRNSKWRSHPKQFSSTDIIYVLSFYLSRLDMFNLIVSLSNVRISESIRNLL